MLPCRKLGCRSAPKRVESPGKKAEGQLGNSREGWVSEQGSGQMEAPQAASTS